MPDSPSDSSSATLVRTRWALALYWLTLAVVTHWPRLVVEVPGIEFKYDKIAHFGAFALLTILIIHARLFGLRRSWLGNLLWAGLLTAAYATLDEFTQQWFQRTTALDDGIVNILAVGSALLAQALTDSRWRGPTLRIILCRVTLCVLLPLLGVAAFTSNMRLEAYVLKLAPALGLEVQADKLGHFWGAALLLWLIYGAAPLGGSRRWRNLLLTTLLVAAAGPSVEFIQLYVGRGYELADMMAHELGVGLGLVGWLAIWLANWLTRPERLPHRPQLWAQTAEVEEEAQPTTPAGEVATDDVSARRAAAQDQAAGKSRGFVGAAMVVSILTFLSRLTGLGRDSIQARTLGQAAVADSFAYGFQVPNLFRRLFGEGALTAAFLPLYTDLLQKDKQLARRFAWLCLTLMAAALGVLTIIGELVLGWLYATQVQSPDTELTLRLTMIMLPYMLLVCLVAMFGTILQVHGKFAPAAAQPILLNVVMSAAMLWATWGLRHEHELAAVTPWIAGSVVFAGIWQCLSQGWILLRYAPPTFRFHGAGPAFKTMLATWLPMLVALSVFQINTFVDSNLAYFLSPKAGGEVTLSIFGFVVGYPIEPGGLAAMFRSQLLYQFPLGVFGIAIATAVFPALAHAAALPGIPGQRQFEHILRTGLKLTVFVGLPAGVGLLLVRLPVSRVLFEGSKFTLDDGLRCANIVAAYAPAIWAYSMTHVLTRAFYAMKDSRTPMILSILMVALNFLLNITLVWFLGTAGLALSTTICAILQCLLLLTILRHYVDKPIDRTVWVSWGRSLGLSLAMGAALLPALWYFPPETLSRRGVLVELVVMVVVGGAVYLGGAWLTGAEELSTLRRRKQKTL